MLRNIRKCAAAKAHRISHKINWDVTLDELDKFIGLVISRGILAQRFSNGKFVGIPMGISDFHHHSIKAEFLENNAILTVRPEE